MISGMISEIIFFEVSKLVISSHILSNQMISKSLEQYFIKSVANIPFAPVRRIFFILKWIIFTKFTKAQVFFIFIRNY